MSILVVDSLSKIINKNKINETIALANVSLSINKGEFIALYGKVGSGKSTLLKVIAGLETPSRGSIIFNDNDISNSSTNEFAQHRKVNIGYVGHDLSLIENYNVYDNIIIPLILNNEEVNDVVVEQFLKILKLKNKTNYIPSELNNLERLFLAIGRALIKKPVLLLLDEPTRNLSNEEIIDFSNLIKLFSTTFKQTIILATTDEDLIIEADRVININHGIIEEEN